MRVDAGDTALRGALLKLASSIDAATVELARAATDVRSGWQGPHRSRFEAVQARRNAQAVALIADCRRLAAR